MAVYFFFFFFFAEKMASEVAHGSSWKKKSNKRKSYHGTLHIPRGKDVTDELMRNYDDNPDMMDDVDIKEMTMTLSSKRKLRYDLHSFRSGVNLV